MTARSHRIIIVGGGAGGLELAVRLAKAGQDDVLLVDCSTTHVWKPRLHELAAGVSSRIDELDYAGLAEKWGFMFQQGGLAEVDPGQTCIKLQAIQDSRGHTLVPECTLGYQALVLALGGVTPDLGVDGVSQHAMMLDDKFDAQALSERFSTGLLARSMAADDERADDDTKFNVVIVGSGATGVELGAYLATDYLCTALAPYTRLPGVNISILEAADTFMPGMDDSVRQQVARRLGRAGVTMESGQQVTRITPRQTETADGRVFPAQLTVWATGRVGPPVAARISALETNDKRQWQVRPTLQTPTSDSIFALGDCAYCQEQPVPPTAQVASEQAKYLASAVPGYLAGGALQPFVFEDKGTLLSLGEAGSLGRIRGFFGRDTQLHGRLAHAAYLGLQRRHQTIVLGALKGFARIIGNMISGRIGPRMKVHWTQN